MNAQDGGYDFVSDKQSCKEQQYKVLIAIFYKGSQRPNVVFPISILFDISCAVIS